MRTIKERLFVLAALLVWAGAACADVFTVTVEAIQISFICDGAALVDVPCKIEIKRGSNVDAIPAEFASKPTRYAHLLKEGTEKAIANYQPPYKFSPADASLLRRLAFDKCYPGVGESLDTLELCVPAEPASTIVIFKRDVCDRCEFQPIILRRKGNAS